MVAYMTYLSSLSKVQWLWLVGTLAIAVLLVAIGWIWEPVDAVTSTFPFTTEMSIRDIAPEIGVTNKALAREIGLPIGAPKGKPLRKLGIAQEELDRAIVHLSSHRPSQLRYSISVALALCGLVFLCRLGRPDGSPRAQRRIWYPRTPYVLALLAAGVAGGFGLGKSPNPMEGIVKVFKSMVGLYPSVADKVIALAFFLLLAVVGNKLVCGWTCPFGALQELLYSLPVLKRIKRKKVPFLVSNAIRTALFVAALLLLFNIVGGREGFVLYHSVNPFNLFDLDFGNAAIVFTIIISLVLSLLTYRPFCQFVCPFGLISWLVERLSLARIRINASRCNQCGVCVKACPLDAAKGLVAGKLFAADCYSCARCLNVCPQDAITYGWSFGRMVRGKNADSQYPI
jgi:Pyruvate/2-oxoacid:ferredoxin oxidoreductase delta subunit